jgi:hypothetical protein
LGWPSLVRNLFSNYPAKYRLGNRRLRLRQVQRVVYHSLISGSGSFRPRPKFVQNRAVDIYGDARLTSGREDRTTLAFAEVVQTTTLVQIAVLIPAITVLTRKRGLLRYVRAAALTRSLSVEI